MVTINRFSGTHTFLSNFYHHKMTIKGITYLTNEHYFQSKKTLDEKEANWIIKSVSAKEAKYRGRKITLRKDWNQIREKVMLDGLICKFKDLDLLKKLIATYPDILIEGNTWHDNFWGDCHCPRCRKIIGKNKLGELLMKVRNDIMKNGNSFEIKRIPKKKRKSI